MFPALSRRLAIAAICLSLAACATYNRTRPAPAVDGAIAVNVLAGNQLSTWGDLPVGAYRVPDSDVIVMGHQRGQGIAAMMFGVVGLAIAHAANSSATAAGTTNVEQILRIRLSEQTRAEVDGLIARAPLAERFGKAPGAAQLDVSSALLLSYLNDGKVRPFIALKVALNDADRRPVWETRYFASLGQTRSLEGADSWTAGEGDPLRQAVSAGLRRALRFMLEDVVRPYPRDDEKKILMEADFPAMAMRLRLIGYRLWEDEQHVAFSPRVGDGALFSGVYLLDKDATSYRLLDPDDPLLRTRRPGDGF